MAPLRTALLFLFAAVFSQGQQVFINEFHYDDAGTDEGEGIEIAGPAGTLLGNYEVVLYNGNGGASYGTLRLSGSIPNQSNGAGAVWFPLQGIQNGNPDGLVLYHWPSAAVVQRISYGGTFTAVGGVAAGQILPNIGAAETASTPAGHSLQLTGTGTALPGFTWAAPRSGSPGALNAGQVFSATPVRNAAMLITPGILVEGETASLELFLTPPPPVPVTYQLGAGKPGMLSMPSQITVPVSGSVSVPVTALTDGDADGFQETGILAQPGDSAWPAAAAGVQIIDADRPRAGAPGTLRLMSCNVKLGTGSPGSAEFNAVRETVERISPDVLVMQEVAGTNVFADWLTLGLQAGFPSGAPYVAIAGDAFEGQPYVRGDISGSQDLSVVTMSRYPVKRRIQLGRGVAGRSELTRYPLLTVIDVPWLGDAEDPVIVNVHLKAEGGDANNFRRALEALRLREYLTAAGIDPAAGNVIIAGDFNATDWQDQPVSYATNVAAVQSPGIGKFADGTALPLSFSGGADLTANGLTLPYRSFPHSGMNPSGLTALPMFQADGSTALTFAFASYKLDYFFVSPPIAARGGVAAEIYNSRLEAFHDGLPKRKTLPAPGLSTTASDHFAVFADIPLRAQPSLRVVFSEEWVSEGDAGLTATVTAVPPPATPVSVTLAPWRDNRIAALPAAFILSPAQASVTLPVVVPRLAGVEPHRRVALTASADGFTSGTASVQVRNREASGMLVLSRYHEPATGSAPRAVELLNASGAPVNFAETPLHIRRYSNGDSNGVMDAEATSGILPAGAVIVVGDEVTGDYLVAQGIIPSPSVPFASQDEHTVSLNSLGQAAFLLDHVLYNGNDALEILLDGTRCDVFGEIGHDPGSAWTGPGIEKSADGALVLKPELATGSSGWRLPGRRFTSSDSGLSGFGIAPVISDPYLVWADQAGLNGMARSPGSDPDADGSPNLVEYGLLTSPANAASVPALEAVPGAVKRRVRSSDATLTFSMESGSGLNSWQAAAGSDVVAGTFPDGSELRIFTPNPAFPGQIFLRQRVSRP